MTVGTHVVNLERHAVSDLGGDSGRGAARLAHDSKAAPSHLAGLCAPDWLLPVAALACLSFPLAILISTGEAGTDRYNREVAGVTLQSRAVDQFKGWIDGIKDDGDATDPSQVRDPSQATRAH